MTPRIKVASPSFSKNAVLREETERLFPGATLNTSGERLQGDALADFLGDADGAVIGLEPVDAALLSRCPSLRMVAKYGVGLDNLDAAACERAGVEVGWTPGVNKRSVSELTLAFLLGLSRNVFRGSTALRGGAWEKDGGRQLSGRTVGIIGAGNVGRDLVTLLQPFGVRILVNDVVDQRDYYRKNGLVESSKDEIYATADFVTLHCPLTPETRNLIDARALAKFRPDAFLVNTARGDLVDEDALRAALESGRLAGAALDVYRVEPPSDPKLLSLPNLVCTPHIGGNALEAVLAMGRSALSHLSRRFGAAERRKVQS